MQRFKLDDRLIKQMINSGVDILSVGNSIFTNHALKMFDKYSENLLPPLNHPVFQNSTLSKKIVKTKDKEIIFLNICGREGIFTHLGSETIPSLENPFENFDNFFEPKKENQHIIVTFMSHSTMEKETFSYYLDGKVDIMAGFGTYVKTADEKILKDGLHYITDLGRVGVQNGVAGLKPEQCINVYRTEISEKFKLLNEEGEFSGILVDLPGGFQPFLKN
jgi:calcineurin-like phosphoesterase